MSALLFLKRFIREPMRIASVVPSSKTLVQRVSSKFDFTKAKVIAEYGPGEGCHTRELLRQLPEDAKLLLFELDPHLSELLEEQFAGDPRVIVLNMDAQELPSQLEKLGLPHCDYILSGIPFSILETGKKRELVRKTFDALAPSKHAAFVVYQVTNELKQHAGIFPRVESEYCLQNIPPMFITVYFKLGANGNGSHPA